MTARYKWMRSAKSMKSDSYEYFSLLWIMMMQLDIRLSVTDTSCPNRTDSYFLRIVRKLYNYEFVYFSEFSQNYFFPQYHMH